MSWDKRRDCWLKAQTHVCSCLSGAFFVHCFVLNKAVVLVSFVSQLAYRDLLVDYTIRVFLLVDGSIVNLLNIGIDENDKSSFIFLNQWDCYCDVIKESSKLYWQKYTNVANFRQCFHRKKALTK